jgi:CDP-diacylglycerol--glycerol-3-phosphate 3-phosphatidyltransferase
MKHIPNTLTLGRLVLTVVFIGMILYTVKLGEENTTSGYLLITFILFIVTALTDIVDGWLARRFDVTSKFGRIVDPLADKFLVVGGFFCFAIIGQPKFAHLNLSEGFCHFIRWGVLAAIVARELSVTILRHIAEARGISFGATWSGKVKMFLQSFGIGTVLIKWGFVTRAWGDWLTLAIFALLAGVTIYSGIDYFLREREALK